MRRPAQGGTSRPGPARPGSGYGRPVGSRPVLVTRTEQSTDPAWWFEREFELEFGRFETRESDHSAERA
jgi:hypothetical protein